jgi:hypothetical protein
MKSSHIVNGFGFVVLTLMVVSAVFDVRLSSPKPTTQITAEQIAATEKEFAGAERGDLVQLGNQILAFDVKVGDTYRFQNVFCDYRFFNSEDLVREKTKLLKNADTPEFNTVAREFLKGH